MGDINCGMSHIFQMVCVFFCSWSICEKKLSWEVNDKNGVIYIYIGWKRLPVSDMKRKNMRSRLYHQESWPLLCRMMLREMQGDPVYYFGIAPCWYRAIVLKTPEWKKKKNVRGGTRFISIDFTVLVKTHPSVFIFKYAGCWIVCLPARLTTLRLRARHQCR